jgi:hypothetical protein
VGFSEGPRENRLRITYVAIRHLHAGISAVLLCFWRGCTSWTGLARSYQTVCRENSGP